MGEAVAIEEFREQIDNQAIAERLVRRTNQRGAPLRSQILELNQSLRGALDQMGHLEDGTIMGRIPEGDFYILMRRFPELNSTDPAENNAAWEKFWRDPVSEPYRVRRNDGRRIARGCRGY